MSVSSHNIVPLLPDTPPPPPLEIDFGVPDAESNTDELIAVERLYELSVQLVHADKVEALYDKILDTAVAIMHSQFASMQMFYPQHGEAGALRLLANRGFTAEAAKHWEWVRSKSTCSCGEALEKIQRIVVADIEQCDALVGTQDLEMFRKTGIRACQSTPLISRTGNLLGMISTHWRTPHTPSKGELRLFDMLARQAADLIDRIRAEEALRLSEECYRLLFDKNPDGVFSLDTTGRFTMVNEAWEKLSGYSRTELLAKTFIDVCAPDELRHTTERFIETLHKGFSIELETAFIHKDGGRVEAWISGQGLVKHGRVVSVHCTIRDITERKAAREILARSKEDLERVVAERTAKLQELVTELEHFSYTITHDMRAPLRAMRGFAELVQELSAPEDTMERAGLLKRIAGGGPDGSAYHRRAQLQPRRAAGTAGRARGCGYIASRHARFVS